MKTELVIVNKGTGTVWECSNSTTTISWETNRTGSPGTLKFTLIKSGGLVLSEGDIVRYSVDGQLQFYGWVFTRSVDRWGVTDVTCYDRLRYLKANASYAFYSQTVGDIVRQIAADLQIDVGAIADTGYAIPSLIEQDQSCLDIIEAAIQQTLLNTGRVYVLYDNGVGLSLQEPASMISGTVIGERSLLTDYTYQSDIDSQTYNSIKLSRPNEATGRSDVFIRNDVSTIARWGMLQLYQTVDGALNDAQANAQAQASLDYYNRPMQSFKASSLGVPGLRAGQMVMIMAPDVGENGLNRLMLLEKVSHTWENDQHTMDLETLGW